MEFTEQEEKMLETIRSLCRERKVTNRELAAYLGIKGNVISEWFGRRCRSFVKYAHAIAAFFDLPVEVIQGGALPAPAEKRERDLDEELKVALFGGDGEVTEEMWQEVKRFVEFVKHKKDG